MKKKWLLVVGLTSVLAAVLLAGCQPAAELGEVTELNLSSQQQGIWVNGQGRVSATPDIATLRLGIDVEADTVADAQSQASEAMDRVMDALKANGIADKDIQTQSFSIRRMTRWDRTEEEEVFTGFRVSNIVSAKIREIDEAGKVIDDVASAGGDLTRIDSIDFSVEDATPYYADARKEAMKNAEETAGQLAELAGVSLGNATYISESSYTPGPIIQRAGFDVADEAIAMKTSISPGELEISVNVQVSYAIK